MKYPKINVGHCNVHDNKFTSGDKIWLVTNLIEQAKNLKPFDLPIAAIYIGAEVWTTTGSVAGMAWHMRRALDVDTSHPVIMDDEGFIMDGWHRVLRAIIDGKKTIKAVRFDKTPMHDHIKETK